MSEKLKSVLSVLVALVIGVGIGAIIYFIAFLPNGDDVDMTVDPNLEKVLSLTSDKEGYCLTDYAVEYELNYANIAMLYKDAMVTVIAPIEQPNQDGFLASCGSGVCLASNGYKYFNDQTISSGSYIVTNHHVISPYLDNDYGIYVLPNEYDNKSRFESTAVYSAELLWADEYLDMAIIYVEENIDWVRAEDRVYSDINQLKSGEKAFAIGSPQDPNGDDLFKQNVITFGSFPTTSLRYSLTLAEDQNMQNIYEYMLEIKVPIDEGNSGGGVFDEHGTLIGLPTLGEIGSSTSKNAINYAVPIYPAILILNDLILQNMSEDVVKIYGLDDLDLTFIDSIESSVLKANFSHNLLSGYKFYGQVYTREEINITTDGLKILNSSNRQDVGKICNKIVINDEEFSISNRNDLIFLLLQIKKDDIVLLRTTQGEAISLNFIEEEEAA